MRFFIFIILFISIITSIYAGEVSIFFTSDTHGRLLESGLNKNLYENEDYTIGGAAYAISYINKIRKEYKDSLLIDCGDIFDGSYINDSNSGQPQIDIMNYAGYSYYVPGNHDFRFGLEKLREYAHYAGFKTLNTNIFNNNENLFLPFDIVEKNGIRIGFLSFLYKKKSEYSFYNKMGINLQDPFEIAENSIKELRNKGVDIIIFINHCGFEYDKKMAQIFKPDVILGGHSHTVSKKLSRIGKTVIAHPGSYYQSFGHLRIIKEENDKYSYKYKLYNVNSQLISPDVEVKKIIEKYSTESEEKLSKTVCRLENDLLRNGKGKESLYDFYVNALKKSVNADIAVINNTGIRDDLYRGVVTIGDIYRSLPFDNKAVVAKIKGWRILKDKYLKNSINIKINRNSYYTVVTNSYIAEKSYTFENFSVEKKVNSKSVRDLIIQYLLLNK